MSALAKLKQHVSGLAEGPAFMHGAWFVAHHLTIIEGLVDELIGRYPEADVTVTRAMVWVHDWGKIVTNKGPDEETVTRAEVSARLPEWGFSGLEIAKILAVYEEMEELKPHGEDFMPETKIISSADALAHYIGPFFALYWWENPQRSVEELIQDNVKKVERDRRKLMLPEVRVVAEPRMKLVLENHADYRAKSYLAGGV